jgi:RNA-binding protein 25
MIRQILAACGHVISWKKVKAFGFCELAGPDAGLRAVRLLHDLMVGDKRLVAKVDAKTKTVFDEYKGTISCLHSLVVYFNVLSSVFSGKFI